MPSDSASRTGAVKPRKRRGEVFIKPELCKGCGFCISFCPTDVLAVSSEFNTHGYHPPYVKNPDACTGCDLCGMFCPDFCIFGIVIKSD